MIRLAEFLVRKRKLLLSLSLLASLLLAIGIPGSGFDTSLSVLMTKSDPYLQEYDRLEAEFPSNQEISFAFVPASGEVFELETLQAIAELSMNFRQIPLALSMSSILGWQSPFGDATLFERPLQQLDMYTAEELQERKQRAQADPFVAGNLLSAQADMALATIRLRVSELDSAQSSATADATRELHRQLQAEHPDVEIHVSSESLYEQSNRSAMISDLTLLLPLILLLCNLVISYSFRSVLLGVCILGIALLTVIMTVGTLGWLALSFNTVSVMAPLVVVSIAVADSVHIISIFRQNLQAGEDRLKAMTSSLLFNIRPITLATITTAIGFASLNFASSPAIIAFGSVVATGVIYAWLLTLFVLPAAVLMLPAAYTAKAAASALKPGSTSPVSTSPLSPSPLSPSRATLTGLITTACKRLVKQYSTPLLWSVTVLGAVALGFSFLNDTDFDRMAFISEDSEMHDYYAAVSEKMERGPTLIYGVNSQQEYGVIEPQFLLQVDSVSEWLREQDEVITVASLVEVIKTINQVFADNDPEAYRIPDDAALIEEHLGNYLQVQARDFTLNNFTNNDFSTLRWFITTRPMTNQQIIDLNARLETEFKRQAPDATLLHGSSTLLFARMDKAVTIELLQGYGFSLLLITLTLIIGMRSIYYGLLSVLPNLLPAVFVFGIWGIFVGELNPFVMMLFSISIGLVVDDTVHVLSTYQTSRVSGYSPEQAVNHALDRAGPAIIITTTVMALGTCVLIAASTLYFQQAATLLVPIVVLALLLDLTFFPALLLRCDRVLLKVSGT